MEIDNYIFKREPREYKSSINPVKDYIDQASTYISKSLNIPKEEAIVLVKEKLKKSNIVNPIVRYRGVLPNGDRKVEEIKLTDYIKESINAGEVIVPSFTTYIHPSIKRSLHADFLSINIAKRKEDKKNAFKYKQLGDKAKAGFYNVLQKVRKIFNNALSGAYASKSTILYNPSAHYTLTSITRCLSSIGNAISESIVAGNKHFRSYDIVMNYISSILTYVNMKDVELCLAKYKLYIPTADDVMKMVLYNTRPYWTSKEKEDKIHNFLTKLNGIELAAILYVNDLWNLKNYNETFVRDMLTKLSKRCTGLTEDTKYLKSSAEGVTNMAHIICAKDIAGMSVNYDDMKGTEALNTLASTAYNITAQLEVYKKLFRTFLTTDVSPIGIAFIKEMIREVIVLSDTDSTCGSYDKWIAWYGSEDISIGTAIAATVMTINTQAMDHNIKILANNMNIQEGLIDLLKMKNEFYWSTFVASNVNKHYYASVNVQEGNVFKEPDLEIKGVQLLSSYASQAYVKRIHNLMVEVQGKISNGEMIYLKNYINAVADMEREIVDKVNMGDISVLRKDKIKTKDSYKQEPMASKYFHHVLWEKVFMDKYGYPGEPSYSVVKVPTIINSKKDMNAYIESLDEEFKQKFKDFMGTIDKDIIATFYLPVNVVGGKGIPKELIGIIDRQRVVQDSLLPAYVLLETLGFYKKEDKMIMEMGY